MGFEPTIKTETWGGSDKSWIRTRSGLDRMKPIMLDMSTFSSNHVVNGKIPSGIALGHIGSGNFYGPYAGSGQESASIAVDATGGTFTITFQGETTAAIAFNAAASAVQSALELLNDINAGDITVSGGPGVSGGGTPYIVAFRAGGQYSGANAPAITTTATSLTGGAGTAAVTTTAGGSGASDGRETFVGYLFEDVKVPTEPGVTPVLATAADVAVALYWTGDVLESKLPTFGGTNGGVVDAVAKSDNKNITYW